MSTLLRPLRRWLAAALLCLGLNQGSGAAADTALDPLRNLFRQHHAVMLLIAADSGEIIEANDAASRFYGYPADTLRHMKIQDINALNPEEIAHERAQAKAEKRNYFIFPHRLANGQIRTVEVYSAPVQIGNEPPLLLSIIHDVTDRRLPEQELVAYQKRLEALVAERTHQLEQQNANQRLFFIAGLTVQGLLIVALIYSIGRRRKAEARLREEHDELEESRAYNRLLFSESGLPLVVMDPESGEFIDCNDAAVRIYGFDRREDLLGKRPRDVSPPTQATGESSSALGRRFIGDALQHGEAVFQWRHVRPNGEQWDSEVQLMRFRHHGQPLIQFSLTDITERLRTERELAAYRDTLEHRVAERTEALAQALAAADAANRSKTSFLANMSHEIRTPLNAVIGTLHLLRRDHPTPEQDKRLQTIASATQHLLGILNDILDLSRIEANKMTLEAIELDPARLIDDVVRILADKAAEKGLTLEVDHKDLPARLIGDPIRIKQGIFNYLGNAIKFTERGGIRVRGRLVADDGEYATLRFEVEDTGIGITPEAMQRLFSPFEQAEDSIARRHGGTGLGLAITRRLAEMMAGEAGAESTPGLGSRFWFTLRLPHATQRPAEPAADLTPARSRTQGPRKRLLLVEDEEINREIALEVLADAPFDIDTAEDGEIALRKVAVANYDLILMDVRMPRVDGLEATRRIRLLPGYASTPILAMTANVYASDRQACEAAGMNDFIGKPFDPDELLATLWRWLDRTTDSIPASPASV